MRVKFSILVKICFIAVLLIIPFQVNAAVFKGVQSGSFTHITQNGNSDSTVTLTTAVDPSKAYLIFQSSHNSADPGGSMIRGQILDANTLQFESDYDTSTDIKIQWYVVEYRSGVKVQRGQVSQSSTALNVTIPTAISSLNQAFLTWSKTPRGRDSSWSSDDPIVGEITSTNNIQFRSNQANSTHIIWWQVIEYTNPADISVQVVRSSMTGRTTNRTVNINSIDMTKSFILSGYRTSGSGSDINRRMIDATFSGSNRVRIRRNASGDNLDEVVLQIVQLNDGVVVQGGETRIPRGSYSASTSISAVNVANSIAFASVQAVGGQNMGRVDYRSNDIVGEGAARLSLSSTQLALTRDRNSDNAYFGWFVLDYSAVPSATPLVLSGATASCAALSTITLIYSANVEQISAETVSNYQVSNPAGGMIGINSVTRTAPNTVTLALSSILNDLTTYTVTVSNVQDLSGATIAPASTTSFTLSCNINCITDAFPGPGALSSSWSASSISGSFGVPRVVQNSRLRLTDASGNVASVATLLNQFPGAGNKIELEFDHYAYAGSGADGIAVTFSDASIPPVSGSFGGALGYAQRSGGAGGPGFSGGWLGIGIDEYGNFANPNEGKTGGSGFERDSVALRGSGSGSTGYPYLTSTGTLSPGIDQSGSTPNPGFRYRISIDHTMGGSHAWAKVERDVGAGYVEIVPNFDIFAVNSSQAAVPANWVVSFTGSTGGATNIHEIGNLKVCAAQPISGYGSPDHYAISHSSPGITCEGSKITVTAHDASDSPFTVTSNTNLTITTTPSVGSIISTPLIIPSGSTSASFYINQTTPLSNIDIDVTDGTATEPDNGGLEDPHITFLDTGFRFYVGSNNTDVTPIGTQIAGKSSASAPGAQTLTLKAVRTNTNTGACVAALQNTTTNVDIAYECTNPTSCSATNKLAFSAATTATVGRNNLGASLAYTPVNMAFDVNGSAPLSFNFADAGKIKLYARKSVAANSPDPAFTLLGSSNAFWTRPDKLVATAKSGATTLNGASPTATPVHKAGVNFDFNVSAVTTSGSLTPNYQPGQLQLLLDRTGPTIGGAEGSLTYASGASLTSALSPVYQNAVLTNFSSGVSTFSSANYSEVGLLNLDFQDSNYGNAGITVSGDAINIGRFIPDHFNVTASNGAFDKACGSFSYLGQGFGYDALSLPALSIVAQNASNSTTANYTETGYQKLVASDVVRVFPNQDNAQLGKDASTLLSVSSTPSTPAGTVAVGATAGTSRFIFNSNDSYRYDKNINSEVGIFISNLSVATTSIQDSDGVSANNLPVSVTPTGTEIRYGRFVMQNAFGPETKNLAMPAWMEYLNASGKYVVNSADNCTSYSVTAGSGTPSSGSISNISVGSGTSNLSYSSPLVSGLGNYLFTAPGSGNEGSIILNVDSSAQNWLQYDWNGDGSLQNHPAVTATFGQYRSHDRVIYWREVEK